MNRLAFLVVILTFDSCQHSQNNASETTGRTDDDSIITNGDEPRLVREIELTALYLSEGGSRLLLELHPMELTINIYSERDLMNAIQTLGPIESDIDFATDRYLNDPSLLFNPEDLNFDGYKDIKVPTVVGSGGTWYVVYLYDPKSERFVENAALSQLVSLVADSVARKIHSHEVGALGGAVYTYTTYRWRGDDLLVERREIQRQWNEETADTFARTVLQINTTEGLDTTALVKVWSSNNQEHWCLLNGSWEALKGTPHSYPDAIKLDGRAGGCPF